MKKLIYPLILLFGFTIIAQETSNTEIINRSSSVTSASVTTFDSRPKDLVGSSYINEKFLPAKMSNSNKIYNLRFNTYQDEMEFEENGKPFHLAKTFDYTITFQGTNKLYRVYDFEYKGKSKKGFFVQLEEGEKYTLLLKEIIKFIPEVKPNTGYDKYKPPTLKRSKDKFFVGLKDNSATELPSKKKEILLLFTDNSKEVEKYVKENKLSFSNKEDLIKIFKYYNTL